MSHLATLVFLCGKMGAGKTTTSLKLAQEYSAILLSEDDWLSALYPEEIRNFDDYMRYSARLKPLLKQHVRQILKAGTSVVMDYPGNTRTQRAWLKALAIEGTPQRLYYIVADNELCLKQLEKRRQAQPERARFDTPEVFRQVSSYFQPPSEDEGFEIVRIDGGAE